VFFLGWQVIDHVVLMRTPMATRHLISFIVGTAAALVIAGIATAELSRQYHRLKELEQTRDDLTSTVVHDLRTPLTSLIGSLQTVQAGAFGELSPDLAEFIDISVKSGDRLLNMVNNLLDISKMEAGPVPLELERVSVRDLVASAVQEVDYLVREKGIDLDVESVPRDLEVTCDVDKIKRLVVNLLSNAIKFTPARGTSTVSAARNLTSITIAVADNGEGIPKEFHEKIFEKFGQVEARKAGRRRSTGLGLTFCKLAVEAHGGRIWVDSTPGAGSTFRFSLPEHPSAALIGMSAN